MRESPLSRRYYRRFNLPPKRELVGSALLFVVFIITVGFCFYRG